MFNIKTMKNPKYNLLRLDNGMKIFLIQRSDFESVDITCYINVGSAYVLNENLATAYILKEKLSTIWNYRKKARAKKAIDNWVAIAEETNIQRDQIISAHAVE
jgi:predicted Zn-dependent peptidase